MADEDPRIKEIMASFVKMQEANAVIDQLRGQFLSHMIEVEAGIDTLLVEFFAPGEAAAFEEYVLSPMNMVTKLRVLKSVLVHVGGWKEHKPLHGRLNKLREERNRFAHAAARVTLESLGRTGGNYDVTIGKDRAPLDLVSIRALINAAADARSDLTSLLIRFVQGHPERPLTIVEEEFRPRGIPPLPAD